MTFRLIDQRIIMAALGGALVMWGLIFGLHTYHHWLYLLAVPLGLACVWKARWFY